MSVRWTCGALAAGLMITPACAGDDSSDQVILVPNDVLADLVEQVACVGDVSARVDETAGGSSDDGDAVAAVVLAPPAAGGGTDLLVVDVTEVVSTIDGDPRLWLDPARVEALVPAIAGAIVATTDVDPALIDRCVERVLTELDLLDAEIAGILDTVEGPARVIDVSTPGVAYFASRYALEASDDEAAVAAAESLRTDDLGGAASYQELMLRNAAAVRDVLTD